MKNTYFHIAQFKLARTALRVEILQNGLRKKAMDTLRNWELNGLLAIKRKQNGYRVYVDEDIRRLKIIRSLRCANYSLSAILRMLGELKTNPDICIKKAIDSPDEADDIITVLLSYLPSKTFCICLYY